MLAECADTDTRFVLAVLLGGDHGGFAEVFGSPGPPLGVLPGGRFILLFLGHFVPLAWHLSLTIPNDISLRGVPLNVQFAMLGDDGVLLLSNAVTAVVGE